jgi:ABC-2 type transport system permease protein
MTNTANQISIELKNLRLYGLQVIISLVVIPFSYMMVVVLSREMPPPELSYQLSGFALASLLGSLLVLLAMRVSNIMQPSVLELYATLPVTTAALIVAQVVTYLGLALPQVVLSLAVSASFAPAVRLAPLLAGVLSAVVTFTMVGVGLGLAIINVHVAQGVLPLLSWTLLLVSPVYYHLERLHGVLWVLAVVNPVTHALNAVRMPLGFSSVIPLTHSYLYMGCLVALLVAYALKRVNRIYMIEKIL